MLLHFFVIRPSEAVGQSIGRASVLVEEHEIAKEPLELDEDDAHFNLGICRRQEAKLVGCYAEDAVFKVPRRSSFKTSSSSIKSPKHLWFCDHSVVSRITASPPFCPRTATCSNDPKVSRFESSREQIRADYGSETLGIRHRSGRSHGTPRCGQQVANRRTVERLPLNSRVK